jgi:hypothetical protein
MSVRGAEATLTIAHSGGDYRYPILVDPTITQAFANWSSNPGLDNTGWARDPDPSNQYYVNSFGDAGWGRGLYSWSNGAQFYPNQAKAIWYYPYTPLGNNNPELTVYRADFSLIKTQVESSCVGVGIWAPNPGVWDGSTWTSCGSLDYVPASVCATPDCSALSGHLGNHADMLTFTNGSGNRSSFGSYLGGATVYLNDQIAPHVTMSQSNLPDGWVHDVSPTARVNAQDGGIGVKSFRLAVPGAADQSFDLSCTWSHSSPCPLGDIHVFQYSTSGMPEGVQTITATATDAIGNVSAPATSQVKVDHSPPVITLTGSLYGARGRQLNHGVYTSQSCATDSCPMSRDWQFATLRYLPGTHTINVRVSDQVGLEAASSFKVTTLDPGQCNGVFVDPIGATPIAFDANTPCRTASDVFSTVPGTNPSPDKDLGLASNIRIDGAQAGDYAGYSATSTATG